MPLCLRLNSTTFLLWKLCIYVYFMYGWMDGQIISHIGVTSFRSTTVMICHVLKWYIYIYIYMTLYLIQRILKATKQFQIIILQLYKNEFIKITCTCLLLHKSKVSERKMFNQINKYIAPFLFNVLTGFPTLSIKNAGKMETSFYFIVFLFKLSWWISQKRSTH